jgi:hypothetical protein
VEQVKIYLVLLGHLQESAVYLLEVVEVVVETLISVILQEAEEQEEVDLVVVILLQVQLEQQILVVVVEVEMLMVVQAVQV